MTNVNTTTNNTVVNTKLVKTATSLRAMEFLQTYASQYPTWGGRPAPTEQWFGEQDFDRWAVSAMRCAYNNRALHKDDTVGCPYQTAKTALRAIARNQLQSTFNNSVRKTLKLARILTLITENEQFEAAPEWFVNALNDVTPVHYKVMARYTVISDTLFNQRWSTDRIRYELFTPTMSFKSKKQFDGTAEYMDFERVLDLTDEADHVASLHNIAWSVLRDEFLPRACAVLDLPSETTIAGAFFKVSRTVAKGRVAYAEPECAVVDIGGKTKEIVIRGWETSRIFWLTNAVCDSESYTGDPRDYDSQLENAKRYSKQYELCEALYEEFADLIHTLYAGMPNKDVKDPINTRTIRLYTKYAGLWTENDMCDDGSVLFYRDFADMESAVRGAEELHRFEVGARYDADEANSVNYIESALAKLDY